MNREHTIEITVILTETQAWQFAQFLKGACFSDYRSHATSEAEAYHMIDAGEHIRRLSQNKATPRDSPTRSRRLLPASMSGFTPLAASALRFTAIADLRLPTSSASGTLPSMAKNAHRGLRPQSATALKKIRG